MSQHPRFEDAIRIARRRAAELGERAGEWGDELGTRARELRAQLPPVRLPDLRRAPPPPPPPPPRATAAAVAVPALLIAAGAGLGWYAWRLWSQSQARARLDREGGEAGAARPEAVMAHNAVPSDAPVETPDPSAAELTAPAEQVMAHGPAPTPDDFADAGSEGGASEPSGRATPPSTPAPTEGELLASVSTAGFGADAAPHVTPSPTVDEAVKPRAPRKPKPPEVSA